MTKVYVVLAAVTAVAVAGVVGAGIAFTAACRIDDDYDPLFTDDQSDDGRRTA